MNADHHEATSEAPECATVITDVTLGEESNHQATNGIDGHLDPPNRDAFQTVSASKDISDKLILDKIASLNIENHELKTENVEFKCKVSHLEKTCAELKKKSDSATSSIESVKRELSSMVIKYATSEKEVINLKKHHIEIDRKYKEVLKERESLQVKIKELNAEKKQLLTNVERRILEAATLKNENELLKNKLAQADVRVEQLSLQLIEIRGEHLRAKEKLEKIESGFGRIVQSTESQNHQSPFKLVEDESETEQQTESIAESETTEEGDDSTTTTNWTDQYLQCIENNKQLTSKLELVTRERTQYKDHIDRLEAKLAETLNQVKDYSHKVGLIESLKNELINKQNAIDSLKEKFDKINNINRDLVCDIDSSKHKEGELLEYTERLTAKLVSLQSEHNILIEKLKCTEAQCKQFKADHATITATTEQTTSEYANYRAEQEVQVERLQKALDEKIHETEELKRKIDELENDIKIIKRKHISSLKELNKDIQALKRQRDENAKAKSGHASTDANSPTLSSRTNSFNSLSEMNTNNTCDSSSQFGGSVHPNGRLESNNTGPNKSQITTSNTTSFSESTTSSSSGELITSLNDIDKNVLIERILRLQRTLIKRNEKIDFLEEHNEQLTEEVRKKSKLLQYYILKEEAGALATENMDKNKAYLSKRGGGIMASLYNSSSTDDTMTLERSLEINSKLHRVLEDLILKNMTLKENLNTLAAEIDRLSKTK